METIKEDLLHFVWQFRKLPLNLETTAGDEIQIINPGQHNSDAGPDFLGAKIRIGDTLWAGNVEIHVKDTDWHLHNHTNNPAYENIILHVVYEQDKNKPANISGSIPVLVLKPFIDSSLIDTYQSLISAQTRIPCERNFQFVKEMTVKPWLGRIAVERLEHKTETIKNLLAQTKMDWETAFFIWFASCFGFKLNNDTFALLAKSIPLKILLRYQDNIFQIEALLFGQAGLLSGKLTDDYPVALRKEYEFLKIKHQLTPLEPKLWKFMRTRPHNFPTVRIAQLSQILSNIELLLSEITGQVDIKVIRKLLSSKPSQYWRNHFNFDRNFNSAKGNQLGNSAIDILIINAIVPFVFLYGKFHNKPETQELAIDLLSDIKPEENVIIKSWKKLGIKPETATESQALIELYNSYCTQKKCLSCSIGASILLDL